MNKDVKYVLMLFVLICEAGLLASNQEDRSHSGCIGASSAGASPVSPVVLSPDARFFRPPLTDITNTVRDSNDPFSGPDCLAYVALLAARNDLKYKAK